MEQRRELQKAAAEQDPRVDDAVPAEPRGAMADAMLRMCTTTADFFQKQQEQIAKRVEKATRDERENSLKWGRLMHDNTATLVSANSGSAAFAKRTPKPQADIEVDPDSVSDAVAFLERKNLR